MILAINVGSSTVKFAVFRLAEGDDALLAGVIEHSGRMRTTDSEGRSDLRMLDLRGRSIVAALTEDLNDNQLLAAIDAVGHRLVHGGTKLLTPVRIDVEVRAMLDELIPLAPDHLPAEIRAIDDVSRVAPSLPQIACFDTAFHARMPLVARLFGLPRSLADSGVVRFGFHGLSYDYVSTELRRRGELRRRTIVAHLGNGSSIVALLDGISIDTSMGMTPTGGLVMGTRSGDLDPGVLLYLLRSRGFSTSDLEGAVNVDGGLLGISEMTADVRDLLEAQSTSRGASEAIEVFCYQARKMIGAYAAALGGVDALVFTGGIGENSPAVRAAICEELWFLGVELDPEQNRANVSTISTSAGRVRVSVVRTNEEAVIARYVRQALALVR